MTMRKWFVLLLCASFLLGVAAPAAAGVDEDTIELFSQKKEDIEIYDAILADFMAEYPDVKIVQTTVADGTTFLSRVATNDIPDICGIFLQKVYYSMMDEGYFLDLSGEEFLTKVSPEILALSAYDGCQYVLPLTLNGYALYINTKIYADNNLSIPTTYDELVANCEALQAAGVTPFAFPFKETGPLGQNFERLLAGVVARDVQEVTEAVAAGASFKDYPAYAAYMQQWYDLSKYSGDVDPLSTDTDDCARMFANGEVAMTYTGTWGNSVFIGLNPDLEFEAVVPPTYSGVEAHTCGTVDIALAIGADSKNVENAKAFLNYFVRDDVAQKFAEGDKNPNIVSSVNYEIPHMSAISEALSKGQFSLIPTTYWPAGYRDEIQIMLQQLLLDGDVDAFLTGWDELTVEFYTEE